MNNEITFNDNNISSEQALAVDDQSPMAMMIQAKQAGFTTEEIKEMMDLQDRNDARIAKQAFYKALSDFKKNPPRIIKDLLNKQYGSNYTSIGEMVNKTNEAMSPFGLTARWEYPNSQDKAVIIVTCFLAHELGHEISVTLDSPIDVSGSKNPLQGRKSTRTYLKLETYEAVTGVASESGNVNDDGNGATTKPVKNKLITESQQNTIDAMLQENDLRMDIFLSFLDSINIDGIANIPASDYKDIVNKLKKTIAEKNKKV